jgi:uncharacterized protein (DUF1697 family)
MRYAAFLRGINVGGKSQMKMEELRAVLTSLGFRDVATLLNSGNVVFTADEAKASTLARTIEAALEERFGRKTGVIVRTEREIEALIAADVFSGITVTPNTRLYVTLLGDEGEKGGKAPLTLPYASPEGDLRVLRATDGTICSVVTLSPQRGTLDLMKVMEDAYGKNVTTRNWNTMVKVGQSLRKAGGGAS